MPDHDHGIPYISLVLSGGYRERVDGVDRTCGPNESVTHPAGEVHSVKFLARKTRIIRIESDTDFREMADYGLDYISGYAKSGGPDMARLCARFFVELKRADRFSPLALHGLIFELMAELGRIRSTHVESGDPDSLVNRAMEYLRAEFRGPVTLQNAAEELAVHPVYLSREFHRRQGVTFGDYLRAVRIEAACDELANGTKRLCDIASDLGFYDQSHFTHTFRKAVGLTPSDYRRILTGS